MLYWLGLFFQQFSLWHYKVLGRTNHVGLMYSASSGNVRLWLVPPRQFPFPREGWKQTIKAQWCSFTHVHNHIMWSHSAMAHIRDRDLGALSSLTWQEWRLIGLQVQNVDTQWNHNERDGVSNHRHLDCLLNSLLSKKTSKPRVTGHCEGRESIGDWWIPLTNGP